MLKIGIECESIEGPESWGVGRIVKKLLEEISKRPELANEFKFFLYFKSRIPDLPYLNNPIFVKKVIGLGSFSLYYYIFLPAKLWFEKLDAMFFPNYMLPIIFRGKSLVMLTEDIYYEINTGALPWRYKLAYRVFAGWWAVRHATKIMAISKTSKRELVRLFGISPERIVVNQLGVDSRPVIISNSQFTISNEIPSLKPQIPNHYILYVGQAFPRRHLRETMLAFEILVSDTTHYPLPTTHLQLIAVGKDKYNPPIIKKLAEDINRRLGRNAIIYKEYVLENELARLYAGAKLLIYVSSKEAFGLPPLEALGYGIPAVVADADVSHEIFGDNAFFAADPEDPNSIAVAITEGLANQQKREQIKNAASGILTKYTWQKHTDRFLQIVRSQKLQS